MIFLPITDEMRRVLHWMQDPKAVAALDAKRERERVGAERRAKRLARRKRRKSRRER